mgnify:CR=1 FL=1
MAYPTSNNIIVQHKSNDIENITLQGSTLIEFNGTTDNVQITFYSTQGQDIIGGAGTQFKAVLL